jgi:molecular chaperone GrpE (heat shock protein)|tara:strand:+ start:895 stop:1203 length:309 start_codon:yes stop_codon:yes gene_type:complete
VSDRTNQVTPLPDIFEDDRESAGFKKFSTQLDRHIQLSPRSKMINEIETLKRNISEETNVEMRVQMNIRFAKLRQRLKVLKQIDKNNNKFADKLLGTKGNLP